MIERAAVFIDKDGTLVENVPYNADPARVVLAPGVIEGLALLRDAGYALVVISNQSGIARGFFTEEEFTGVRRRIDELLADGGLRLDGFYYCPHHPRGAVPRYAIECMCRKPEPGLIELAAAQLGIDLARSWFVGDILDDVEAGRRAGCRTALIANGNEDQWEVRPLREPQIVAADLVDAARLIIAHEAARGAGVAPIRGVR